VAAWLFQTQQDAACGLHSCLEACLWFDSVCALCAHHDTEHGMTALERVCGGLRERIGAHLIIA